MRKKWHLVDYIDSKTSCVFIPKMQFFLCRVGDYLVSKDNCFLYRIIGINEFKDDKNDGFIIRCNKLFVIEDMKLPENMININRIEEKIKCWEDKLQLDKDEAAFGKIVAYVCGLIASFLLGALIF